MADFVQTMKNWRRMCKAQDELRGDRACYGCPLESYGCPSIYDDVDNADYADVENKVNAWAAEHPEPVYPTWREWLIKLGIVSFEPDFRALLDASPTTLANTVRAYINEEGSKPIPADIAQKLGIEPKE